MTLHRWRIAALVGTSGACALIYQIVWLQAFRLVFGASTAANAAVVAVFMGGLGLGAWLLGPRADRAPRPLAWYAQLELLIAAGAALTPWLLSGARELYLQAGGSAALGPLPATLVRLALTAAVLLPPTILMGGTLPALARAVTGDGEANRESTALIYGINTIGAVFGTLAATFVMIEAGGLRATLWTACCINVLVAVGAHNLARQRPTIAADDDHATPTPAEPPEPRPVADDPAVPSARQRAFILATALVAGFAFMLMELVWYRVLTPLLGGSTYSFGAILSVILAGIGLGGYLFAGTAHGRDLRTCHLAGTCALEALFIMVPFALGDRIAVFAAVLSSLAAVSFTHRVLAWMTIAGLVVGPTAVIAGLQYPLLIALYGRGRRHIGRHTGLVAAANTTGGILGALAGGFGLLAALGAPACWCLAAGLLALLTPVLLIACGRISSLHLTVAPLGLAALAVACASSDGPTAVWRHTPIGAGRVNFGTLDANSLRDWTNQTRRSITWEGDGRESSVALTGTDGFSMIANGKSEGNTYGDRETQIMCGLVAALLHPNPQDAFVIGIGTGCTAGWLASVSTMNRIEIVELEPLAVAVASACTPANEGLLRNPKAHIRIGDGREVLLTSPDRFDLIVSEPSNPYRAGVGSLFTREFYQSAAQRLRPGGTFVQWVQLYEIDTYTLCTVYATLASVFPHIETWTMAPGDIQLICSLEQPTVTVATLAERIAREPFCSALAHGWGAAGLAGVVSRFVGGPALAQHISTGYLARGGRLNTDDAPVVEYGFARHTGTHASVPLADLIRLGQTLGAHRPRWTGSLPDDSAIRLERLTDMVEDDPETLLALDLTTNEHAWLCAFAERMRGDFDAMRTVWGIIRRPPQHPYEILALAEALADIGDPTATAMLAPVLPWYQAEADMVRARFLWRCGDFPAAIAAAAAVLARFHADPWFNDGQARRLLTLVADMARIDRTAAARLEPLLATPFCVHRLDGERIKVHLEVASRLGPARCAAAFAALEPNVPWQLEPLTLREQAYGLLRHPLHRRAEAELGTFLGMCPVSLLELLDTPASAPPATTTPALPPHPVMPSGTRRTRAGPPLTHDPAQRH